MLSPVALGSVRAPLWSAVLSSAALGALEGLFAALLCCPVALGLKRERSLLCCTLCCSLRALERLSASLLSAVLSSVALAFWEICTILCCVLICSFRAFEGLSAALLCSLLCCVVIYGCNWGPGLYFTLLWSTAAGLETDCKLLCGFSAVLWAVAAELGRGFCGSAVICGCRAQKRSLWCFALCCAVICQHWESTLCLLCFQLRLQGLRLTLSFSVALLCCDLWLQSLCGSAVLWSIEAELERGFLWVYFAGICGCRAWERFWCFNLCCAVICQLSESALCLLCFKLRQQGLRQTLSFYSTALLWSVAGELERRSLWLAVLWSVAAGHGRNSGTLLCCQLWQRSVVERLCSVSLCCAVICGLRPWV